MLQKLNINIWYDKVVNLWFYGNFLSIEDIRKKKCNLMIYLSKFTSNKKYWVEGLRSGAIPKALHLMK